MRNLVNVLALATLSVLGLAAEAAEAAAPRTGLDDARWIWFSDAPDAQPGAYPAALNYFRGELVLPDKATPQAANLVITADNLYTVYFNGEGIGESSDDPNAWNEPRRFDVTPRLVAGRNVIAVEAANSAPGPAGLLVKLSVEFGDGRRLELASDAQWKASGRAEQAWQQTKFDDSQWQNASVVGEFGGGPWNRLAIPGAPRPTVAKIGRISALAHRLVEQAVRQAPLELVASSAAPAEFVSPEGILFVADDCSLVRPATSTGTSLDSLQVTIFNPRNSRAYPEHDLPAPMKVGRKLMLLSPARKGVEPRLLLDAGRGALGSPSVSFDGQTVFVSMALPGDPFYHIYRLPSAGGQAQQLTEGPFHDIDPVELPDGRIAFVSTRVGTFEEYHNPPARALFTMDRQGTNLLPLTQTIIFDNEPEVMADGRLLFVRSDNFFDRGKVETLLHAIHPDGTGGHTEFALENGPEYGGRLRAFFCGSPAPLPDGRVAYLTDQGIAVGRPGESPDRVQHFRVAAGDVASLADGRLLCTLPGHQGRYERLAVVNAGENRPKLVEVYHSASDSIHSPVDVAPRPRPPILTHRVAPSAEPGRPATGFLFCQNARFTLNTTAGWEHVRAIRVLAGRGLTTRSSHSYIVHAGSEVTELGTVPLAPDGSFYVEVPADTPLALQAVDAEGRAELNEMSWIYVRPGERRGCIGCHQSRSAAPPTDLGEALVFSQTPLKMLGQGRPHRYRGNNAAVTGLMELQFDRFREVAGLNRHAPTHEPLATGAQEVADEIARLRGSDEGLTISAAQRLAIFRDALAAPALAECLARPSREVRVAAALALATCGNRQSVPPLLAALRDSEPLVAQSAAIALENLTGHAEPFDPWALEMTRDTSSLVWQQWFAQNNWDQIERDLVARLANPDRNIVRRAAVALGHTGGEAARVALRAYVVGQRDENPYPEWRKHHQGDGARFNSLSEANPRTLQAAVRSLGYLRDDASVSVLWETILKHADPNTANLFLAEAAIEALGCMGTPEAEAALVKAFAALHEYPTYTRWYGDHDALMACHASPLHSYIIEALDAIGSRQTREILAPLIRSVPIDPDRALFLANDDYEALVGRVLRRGGAEAEIVETCLALLGDSRTEKNPAIEAALAAVPRCWAGHPTPGIRAAQILSLVVRDPQYEPRLREALQRYRARQVEIPRVFDQGIPIVRELPEKHWVCFYLARSLGNLARPESAPALIEILQQEPAEAANGRPDPLGPGVLFLHNDLTPCWRAAVAWALGQIGDRRATGLLLGIVGNLENATDTRHAAAEALGQMNDPQARGEIQRLAKEYPELSIRRALEQATD